MKKLALLILVCLMSYSANSQFLRFGLKGGLNYNANGDLRVFDGDDPLAKFSSSEEVGYHFGILTEIKLPLFMYIRPELVYTHTESSYESEDGDKSKLKMDKLEIPLLLGFRVFKIGRFFFGPNFQYNINTDLSSPDGISSITNISSDDFVVAGQVGIGLDFGKFGADARWETGFSDSEAAFIVDALGEEDSPDLLVDTSHSQFILSLFYKF